MEWTHSNITTTTGWRSCLHIEFDWKPDRKIGTHWKVIEVQQYHQYVVRVDGTGRATLRNRQHICEFTPFHAKPTVDTLVPLHYLCHKSVIPLSLPISQHSSQCSKQTSSSHGKTPDGSSLKLTPETSPVPKRLPLDPPDIPPSQPDPQDVPGKAQSAPSHDTPTSVRLPRAFSRLQPFNKPSWC